MLESGHSREAVLGYEVPYILGFMAKRVEVLKARASTPQKGSVRQRGRRGLRTETKTMTSDQMLAKVRAQKKG